MLDLTFLSSASLYEGDVEDESILVQLSDFANRCPKVSRRQARYSLAIALFPSPLAERSVTVSVSLRSPVVTLVACQQQVTPVPFWLSASRVPHGD